MSLSLYFVLLFYIFSLISQIFYANGASRKWCRDKDRPISKQNLDKFELVNIILNENITLECNFCNETDDGEPKNWFLTKKPGLDKITEVKVGMENEMELNRIRVNQDHSLSIFNVTENDTGLYYCKRFLEEDVNGIFNYFVNMVSPFQSADMESGNLTAWQKYHEKFMSPINKLLKESQGTEYLRAREILKLSMELVTHWFKWGPCDVCGRPQGEGVKKKIGECRIKLRNSYSNIKLEDLSDDEVLFLSVSEISCRSLTLQRVFPGISNLTKIVPDFVELGKCEGTCNPDKDGKNAGWKVGKSRGFKYRKTFVLLENSHLTLVCPESTLENKVTWRKRGKILRPGDASYPFMYVDTFNTLYLVDVTRNEEGNYTCQVDDIKMEQIVVHIVSKSKFFTEEFVRNMGYLGFIIFLTIPCYFGGLLVTCWRRKTFKTYEELLKENPEDDEESQSLL